MRILHFIKTPQGAAWALKQMQVLTRLGLDIHVALPTGSPRKPQYEAAGIKVHDLQTDFPIREPWKFPARAKALNRLVGLVQPDLLHSHFVGTTLTLRLALGKKHSIPRIFQVPGPLHLEHSFFRRSELAIAGPNDYWIGSCQWTCQAYQQMGVPPDHIFLSYYGTDVTRFAPRPTGKLREMLGLEPDAKIVGMVAYLYPPKSYLGQTRGLKGHEDLIDALALLQKKVSHLYGVFVGGAWNEADWYQQKVTDYARQKLGKRAIFLGTRGDVEDLYPDFDVVAHPSHSENVGGAAESLLMGVPTIATSVGGFPDVVKPGKTGWLVPPHDPVCLAEAIADALEHPPAARQMAQSGRALVKELFDVERTAPEIKQIYQRVLVTSQTRNPAVAAPGGIPQTNPLGVILER